MIPAEPRLPDDSLPRLTRQLTTLWRGLSAAMVDAVSFLGAGAGAITRALRAKVQEIEVSVFDFMTAQQIADVTARTVTLDTTAAIQAAIDYVGSKGGGKVRVPPGAYRQTSGVVNNAGNVWLVGDGRRHSHALALSAADYTSQFVAYGTAGYTQCEWAPVSGAANQRLAGGGVLGIGFDGNGIAAEGLMVRSMWDGEFDVYTTGQTAIGTHTHVVATLGESRDVQDCRFRLRFDHRNSSCVGYRAEGDTGANTSMNTFDILGFFQNGNGVTLGGSDSNYYEKVRLFQQVGGTGLFVEVLGSNTVGLHSGAERFGFYSGAGPIVFRGTASFTTPSIGNQIENLDWANGCPPPTIETGASCTYSDAKGRHIITDIGWERVNPNQLSFLNYAENEQARITSLTTAPTGIPSLLPGTAKATYAADGTATNVDLELLPKGTGRIQVPSGFQDRGTYTPTLTNTANISASTANVCRWKRYGDMVTVFGSAAVTTVAAVATLTTLRVSLPIASNLANAHECAGTCSYISGTSIAAGPVFGNTAADVAACNWSSPLAAAGAVYFEFSYQII